MKTAVDFAVEKLEKFIPSGNQIAIGLILEQAKEMEEQEKVEFAFRAYLGTFNSDKSFTDMVDSMRTFKQEEPIKKYPFNEGETYYLITDQEHIIKLVWDYIAETLYDEDRMYFKTYAEAHNFLLNKDQEQ